MRLHLFGNGFRAVPSHKALSVAISLSVNGQQFSSSGVTFTYRPAVAVSSLWPARGATEGGTPVTVLGSGFSAAAEVMGALLCRFNASVGLCRNKSCQSSRTHQE